MSIAVKILQGLAFLLAAPLVTGLLQQVRAWGQLRAAPRPLQPYYDLFKLFRKGAFRPAGSSWIFRAAPYVSFSCYGVVGFGLPVIAPPLLSLELVTLAYVIGLATFFNALAGMAIGTPFGSMGSSRAMFLHVLTEPNLLTVILALSLKWHTTNLMQIVEAQHRAGGAFDVPNLLLLAAMYILTLVAAHRAPIDNLETNLELTMTSRAALLEYSGPHLALAQWAESLKLLVFLTLAGSLFLPFGLPVAAGAEQLPLQAALFLAKLLALVLLLAVWELCNTRLRFRAVVEPNLYAQFIALSAIIYTVVSSYFSWP